MQYIQALDFFLKTVSLHHYVKNCNITFIGPDSDIIEKTGNKQEARNTMISAGIPVIPGTKEPVMDAERGKELADNIGYPVMVKAAIWRRLARGCVLYIQKKILKGNSITHREKL